jgi:hypothetical protein
MAIRRPPLPVFIKPGFPINLRPSKDPLTKAKSGRAGEGEGLVIIAHR